MSCLKLPDFTKCILLEGDNSQPTIKEGQWFKIKCKKLFDSSIFEKSSMEELVGFEVNSNDFTEVRLRLGNNLLVFILTHF